MKSLVKEVLERSRAYGWVLEPDAKEILREYGIPVTRYAWVRSKAEALREAETIGYPLVAKVVSPDVLHKSDTGGVVVGVKNGDSLEEIYRRFEGMKGFRGMLLDEMAVGVEFIIGSKDDPQFGPVVLAGLGGTSVEVYRDVAVRMAPITAAVAMKALESLKGIALLKGYRGGLKASIDSLADLMVRFSETAFDLNEMVESIDCNPVMCSAAGSVVADARIILKKP